MNSNYNMNIDINDYILKESPILTVVKKESNKSCSTNNTYDLSNISNKIVNYENIKKQLSTIAPQVGSNKHIIKIDDIKKKSSKEIVEESMLKSTNNNNSNTNLSSNLNLNTSNISSKKDTSTKKVVNKYFSREHSDTIIDNKMKNIDIDISFLSNNDKTFSNSNERKHIFLRNKNETKDSKDKDSGVNSSQIVRFF